MPNINLDDAYILDETGAQVDKVTGLFTKDEDTTSGEKAFAQLNIGTAGSNRNLFDNPFFTVRQRGDGPFTSGYTADRWVSTSGATVTLNASGTLTWTTSSTYREFKQKIANPTYYANGTYTVSVNVVSATGVPWIVLHNGNSGEILRKALTVGMNSVTFTTGDSGIGMFGVYNLASANISVELKAVKLELGSVSTLANDAPPKEDQATADCKWYFQRIQQEDGYTAPVGFGIVTVSTNILRTLIPLSSPLRKAGTLTATATNIGQMRVQGNGSNLTPTAITGRGVLNGNAIVDITVAGTLANNQFYTLVFANSTAIIDLSKDI